MSKRRRSAEEIIQAIKSHLSGHGSMEMYAGALGVNPSQFYEWMIKYQIFGSAGLLPSAKALKYSSETKKAAVEEYLK